nr:hypothetical protein [Tanacetum cinerariifolium]
MMERIWKGFSVIKGPDCAPASDIYFIGGFGTVAWVNVSEYEALRPDKIAVDGGEQNLKFNIQRLAFEEGHGVETLEEAKAALWNLIHRDCRLKLEHNYLPLFCNCIKLLKFCKALSRNKKGCEVVKRETSSYTLTESQC